ncbi:hypothetical protein, partial [Klebsiella pneumoniae]|uniref:hypothetical protein n=1 Tax=Klebsiella pneumoniae TaxID=573 RepID=UPI00405575EC
MSILLIDFLPQGETINANRYCETLKKLRRAIQNKRRGMLTSGDRTAGIAGIAGRAERVRGSPLFIQPEPPEDLNSIEIEVFSDVQSELDE